MTVAPADVLAEDEARPPDAVTESDSSSPCRPLREWNGDGRVHSSRSSATGRAAMLLARDARGAPAILTPRRQLDDAGGRARRKVGRRCICARPSRGGEQSRPLRGLMASMTAGSSWLGSGSARAAVTSSRRWNRRSSQATFPPRVAGKWWLEEPQLLARAHLLRTETGRTGLDDEDGDEAGVTQSRGEVPGIFSDFAIFSCGPSEP